MQTRASRWMNDRLGRRSRRWFLRGTAGVAVTLPLLNIDREQPQAFAAPGDKRFFYFHIPAGINVTEWAPSGSGTNYNFGPTQAAMDAAGLKPKTTMVTNVNGIGGPRGHTCGISGVLTGVQCAENSSNNAVSMDQVIAQYYEGETRFSSIELGTSHNRENPNAEAGYSTVIKDNLSWANNTTPKEKEVDPSRAFNRLFDGAFGSTSNSEPSDELQAKDAVKRSVLDYVRTDTEALIQRLGQEDKAKVDQFLTGLRDLESSIQSAETNPVSADGCNPGADPGTPMDIEVHVDAMLDIMVMAFQCDITRVASFAYEHTTTERSHNHLGVSAGWHSNVTHHANSASALADYATVNRWLVDRFAYLATRLDAIEDGAGTLLDSSVGMFFSELSDGDSHSSSNLPVMLVGSAGGALNTGQLVSGGGGFGANIEQVHLAILQAMGTGATSFGRATSPLAGLLT